MSMFIFWFPGIRTQSQSSIPDHIYTMYSNISSCTTKQLKISPFPGFQIKIYYFHREDINVIYYSSK